MKKLLIVIVMMIAFAIPSMAQNVKREGQTFIEVKSEKTKSEPVLTPYTYKDAKGVGYPIYMGSTGSCFIIKVSKNGNEYRKYLGEEISAPICKEMGVEYKPKSKN